MLKEATVVITIILALLQVNRCAVPIEIVELPINKKTVGTIDLMIPHKDPIISRRQRYYKYNPDFYFYDYPLKYYDERWVDDDYMPFLTAAPKYNRPDLEPKPGLPLLMAQIIPILKSMFFGKGVKQGPGVRIHKKDLWLWEPLSKAKTWFG